jgi:hypothetical protein
LFPMDKIEPADVVARADLVGLCPKLQRRLHRRSSRP